MNWFSEVVLIISITTIIHKVIDEISLNKFKKDRE